MDYGDGKLKTIKVSSKGKEYDVLVDDDFDWKGKVYLVKGRPCIWKDGRDTKIYRYIMKAPDGAIIDHEDGDVLNNLRSNLRFATSKQNSQNRRCKGYHYDKQSNRWVAQIKIDGKGNRKLGKFDNEEDAKLAYQLVHAHYNKEYSPYYKTNKGNEELTQKYVAFLERKDTKKRNNILTPEVIGLIIAYTNDGFSASQIAGILSISKGSVYRAKRELI